MKNCQFKPNLVQLNAQWSIMFYIIEYLQVLLRMTLPLYYKLLMIL